MKTLLIDNYDSFTFNLFQIIAELGGKPEVFRNDELTLANIKQMHPTHIVISPGPGTVVNQEDSGICLQVIRELGKETPLLGVCLGHQGIAYAFGGKIETAPIIMHGKTSQIEHTNSKLFKGVANPFKAMRYHSLRVAEENFPEALEITARVPEERTIMAIEHRQFPIFGIQFHPESFGTPEGKKILKNFLNYSLFSVNY